MKPLRKIYCRSFQTVLKLSIPFLPYRRPKMIGGLRKLPDILKRKKKKRVLIVTDPGIRGLGLLIPLERALSRADISYYIYEGTVANPTTTNIYEAVEMYFSNDCQAIIGFGGGSSLDCAKGGGRPHRKTGYPSFPTGRNFKGSYTAAFTYRHPDHSGYRK